MANPFSEAQARHWDHDAQNEERTAVHESWFNEETADYWRHARMYEPARLLDHLPELTWLTVGDGRFGLDSIRIKKLGFRLVLPTDIGDALLKRSVKRGLIDDYRSWLFLSTEKPTPLTSKNRPPEYH